MPLGYIFHEGAMHRRFFLSAPLLIAACSTQAIPTQPNTVTVSVDLANAQRQAKAMADVANQWAQQAAGSMSGSSQQALQVALQAMSAAVSAFVGLPSGQAPTAAQYAEAASKAIMAVIPLLPIPAIAKIGIEAGLALVEAFAAGMSTITVPTTTQVAGLRRDSQRIYQAPVPLILP